MANRDEIRGFEPYGECLRVRPYVAGGTVYPGDLVKQDNAGKIVASTAAAAAIGVAMNYAVVDTELLVCDHPDQEFVAQVASTEIDVQTDFIQNLSITAGSPNTTYRRSGMELDGSTLNTTATLEIKILRLLPRVGNALGDNTDVICKINNHQLGSHTGTAGV